MVSGRLVTAGLRALAAATALLLFALGKDTQADTDPLVQTVSPSAARIALVVGNSRYRHAIPALNNAVKDAQSIAAQLGALGFDTKVVEDLPLAEMKTEVRGFVDKLRAHADAVALFFYAGHAIQVAGANYLLPVDADIQAISDIDENAYDLSWIINRLRDAGSINILILDACRNNPFTQYGDRIPDGLSSFRLPRNSFVAYATQPDRVALDGEGEHSPYSSALLRYVPTPGIKVEEVFKQVRGAVEEATQGQQLPWDASTLRYDFYFRMNTDETAARPTAESEEEGLWLAITEKDRPDLYQSYLDRYPKGRFVQAAKRMLESLKGVSEERSREEPLRDAARKTLLGDDKAEAAAANTKIAGATRGISITPAEMKDWETIRQSDQATDFATFAKQHPRGFFRDVAQRISVALEDLDDARMNARRAMKSQNRLHHPPRIVPPGVE